MVEKTTTTKQNPPVSHSHVGGNAELMRQDRAEQRDWFELTGRLAQITTLYNCGEQKSKTLRRTSYSRRQRLTLQQARVRQDRTAEVPCIVMHIWYRRKVFKYRDGIILSHCPALALIILHWYLQCLSVFIYVASFSRSRQMIWSSQTE